MRLFSKVKSEKQRGMVIQIAIISCEHKSER